MADQCAKQAFYDKTVEHLLQQGFQSADSEGFCRYRNGGPNEYGRCAIGIHIPDSLYDSRMEGNGIGALIREWPEIAPLIPSLALATSLQNVHDSAANWHPSAGLNEDGNHNLVDIAVNFGLTPHPLLTS